MFLTYIFGIETDSQCEFCNIDWLLNAHFIGFLTYHMNFIFFIKKDCNFPRFYFRYTIEFWKPIQGLMLD